MAKFFVGGAAASTVTPTSITVGTGTFRIGVPNVALFAIGDVVRYRNTANNNTAFGVVYFIDSPSGAGNVSIGYDQRIYTDTLTLTNAVCSVHKKTFLSGLNVKIDSVESYSISEELSQAFYSTSYIRYNIERRHILNISNSNRKYLGDFGIIMSQNPLFFVDDCANSEGVAYSIAATERTTEFINNVFKQKVEFRIASK